MDKERLHRLLSQKMREIQRYLIRLGANRPDAEDIVQDTLYKAFLYLDSIEPAQFSAWLYRVALNRYYDLYRKQRRVMEIPLESVEIEDAEAPEQLLLQKEQREGIEKAMDELPPVYRQLLIMKYELEFSYQEIAKLLDMKPEMVKTYLFRARKQFAKRYGG